MNYNMGKIIVTEISVRSMVSGIAETFKNSFLILSNRRLGWINTQTALGYMLVGYKLVVIVVVAQCSGDCHQRSFSILLVVQCSGDCHQRSFSILLSDSIWLVSLFSMLVIAGHCNRWRLSILVIGYLHDT